jgi:osomolarity two-component system, response regulator SKN7
MEDDGRINPLAGMGLMDEQYVVILQNLVGGKSWNGGLDGGGGGVVGMCKCVGRIAP